DGRVRPLEGKVRGHPGAGRENALVLWPPEMDRVRGAAAARLPCGNAEGVECAAAAVRLREGRACPAVAEAAHAAEPAEVMVEGSVLLDHDDDVLDVGEARRCRPRGELARERIHDEAGAQREARREKLTTGEPWIAHPTAV